MLTMRRGLLCLVGLAIASVAIAKVCPDCEMRMILPACGECEICGGQTSSLNYKICATCSEKLQQCQMCRESMAATRPATQPDDRERLPRVRPLH